MLPKESCCKDIDFNIKRGREPRKGLPLLVTYLRPTQTLIVGVVVPDEVGRLKEVFDELAPQSPASMCLSPRKEERNRVAKSSPAV